MADAAAAPPAPPPAQLVRRAGAAPVALFGLSLEERLRRGLRAAGVARVDVHAEAGPTGPTGAAPDPTGRILLVAADAVIDERLLRGLVAAPGSLLLAPGPDGRERPVAAHVAAGDAAAARAALLEPARAEALGPGIRRVAPAELADAWQAALRKSQPPFCHAAPGPELARALEEQLFRASYKGLTDLVTRWVWPRPALACVRWLAARGVHPNAITALSWLLALLAFGLFWQGRFGAGLAAAWLMTFLDTVDGKLARCTLTSSPLGHVLDHGLDLLHPPFWWLAFGLGLPPGNELATAVVVGGYLLGRLEEGLFLLRFGIEIHTWQPLDGLFRTITARRNPNLLLLSVGALGGRPDLGLVLVALWTVLSLAFHAARLVQAEFARARGGRVSPWDEAAGGPARRSPPIASPDSGGPA